MTPAQRCIAWMQHHLAHGDDLTEQQHTRIRQVAESANAVDQRVIRDLLDTMRIVFGDLFGVLVPPLGIPCVEPRRAPVERLVDELWQAIEDGRSEHTLQGFTARTMNSVTRAADAETRSYINALRACLAQAQERGAA